MSEGAIKLPKRAYLNPKFPKFTQVAKFSTFSESLILSLGIGILECILRSKADPESAEPMIASFNKSISDLPEIAQKYNIDWSGIEVYKTLLENISTKAPDLSTSFSWLNSYSEQNPKLCFFIGLSTKLLICSLFPGHIELHKQILHEKFCEENILNQIFEAISSVWKVRVLLHTEYQKKKFLGLNREYSTTLYLEYDVEGYGIVYTKRMLELELVKMNSQISLSQDLKKASVSTQTEEEENKEISQVKENFSDDKKFYAKKLESKNFSQQNLGLETDMLFTIKAMGEALVKANYCDKVCKQAVERMMFKYNCFKDISILKKLIKIEKQIEEPKPQDMKEINDNTDQQSKLPNNQPKKIDQESQNSLEMSIQLSQFIKSYSFFMDKDLLIKLNNGLERSFKLSIDLNQMIKDHFYFAKFAEISTVSIFRSKRRCCIEECDLLPKFCCACDEIKSYFCTNHVDIHLKSGRHHQISNFAMENHEKSKLTVKLTKNLNLVQKALLDADRFASSCIEKVMKERSCIATMINSLVGYYQKACKSMILNDAFDSVDGVKNNLLTTHRISLDIMSRMIKSKIIRALI